MILILYSISHLGQKKFCFFFMARAGFDVRSLAEEWALALGRAGAATPAQCHAAAAHSHSQPRRDALRCYKHSDG